MRAQLRKAVRPLVDQLAERIVEVIATRIEGSLEEAINVARAALLAESSSEPIPTTPTVTARAPRPDSPARVSSSLSRASSPLTTAEIEERRRQILERRAREDELIASAAARQAAKAAAAEEPVSPVPAEPSLPTPIATFIF